MLFSLQFAAVQTYLTQRVADFLGKELQAKITLEKVFFKPFSTLTLHNLAVVETSGDTTLSVKELHASLNLRNFFNNKITIEELKLEEALLNYEVYADSTNLTKYIRLFSKPKTAKKKPSKKLELKIDKIQFANNKLRLINHKYKYPRRGVNFANLYITELSGTVDKIKIDSVKTARISKLTLKERSGFSLKELSSEVVLSDHKMEFSKLVLRTNRSQLRDYLAFKYNDIKDFGEFIDKVQVTLLLKNSSVDSRDIAFFAPDVEQIRFFTEIKRAQLKGTVKHIVARDVDMTTAQHTRLSGNFRIIGLPNINKTIFDFDIAQLNSTAPDIELLVAQLSNAKTFNLPSAIHHLKKIHYQGLFKGHYNDFDVKGNLSTGLGSLQTDAHIRIDKELAYDGSIKSNSFLLGDFVEQKFLGKTGFNLEFEGWGLSPNVLQASFKGTIHSFHLQNYNYQQIRLEGTVQNRILNVNGSVQDPNLEMNYDAELDWNGEQPNYKILSTISYASPNKLQWLTKDSVIIHHAQLSTELNGNSLNTLKGNTTVQDLLFTTTKGEFLIQQIDFAASGNQNNRKIDLTSDVLDIHLKGNIDLNTVVPYFRSLAMRYAPAINIETTPYNPQNFNLEVKVKSFKPISALLDPNLKLDDGAQLNAQFSSEDYTAQFEAYSPSITYKGIKISNLTINENADQRAFSLNINADRINFSDSTYINHIAISNVLANDSLVFNIELSDKKATNYLNLNGDIYFAYHQPANIHLRPSEIIINRENWNINDDARLRVSKGKIYIENLLVSHDRQKIRFDGILSNDDDRLQVKFNDFSLASLGGVTRPLGIDLQGDMNGELNITSVFRKPLASANIHTSPILYNDIPVGKLDLRADFEPVAGSVLIDLQLLDEQRRGILVNGNYNLYDENEPLNLKGTLKETDLTIFQPFLSNLVSDLRGKGNANVDIKGTFKNPKITGIGRFTGAEFTVNYLNTHYFVNNQTALVENNAIILQNLVLRDIKGNRAQANGLVNLQKLANPYIDVDLRASNFMILNTTFKDNNLYFGTAFASGIFKFKGYTSAIDIDINVKSETGTSITLPFNTAMTVSESDFVYFVSKDSTENQKKDKQRVLQGLTMNMNLNFTPEAEVNLQTTMGSLKGNGNGNINMKISSLGDFEMFGDYVVRSGKFHFTAQDFINKFFDIKEGGTIRWTGNPSEAIINLNAIYQQRTAIGPLYNAAGHSGENERVLAQADMLIKGTLSQPDVTFDLNFPQNPYIKDQLQSYLSDANNINQQALSLIVRRSFTPSSTNEIGREVNNTLLSAGTEIAFNQLNNIISQSLNMNFLDLNIRSFNDASASLRLLNDRLVLSGGISDRSNYEATDLTFFRQGVTTDAELTFKLRKEGNLLLRAYNRPYTRNFLIRSTDAEYISAIGLAYRQEFNSLGEFWRKIWQRSNRKDNK